MKTEELPIVIALKELIVLITKELRNFPRFERYTYGAEIIRYCTYTIEDLSKANRLIAKREDNINRFLSDFEPINILLQICFESGTVSPKSAYRIGKQINKVLKQATAWRNKTRRRERDGQLPQKISDETGSVKAYLAVS